jgi:hypothetical protein
MPPSLKQTRLLHTRCLWVYFRYPTRQQLPPIARTRLTGSNHRLEAKGQLCEKRRNVPKSTATNSYDPESRIGVYCLRLSLVRIQRKTSQLTDRYGITAECVQ